MGKGTITSKSRQRLSKLGSSEAGVATRSNADATGWGGWLGRVAGKEEGKARTAASAGHFNSHFMCASSAEASI